LITQARDMEFFAHSDEDSDESEAQHKHSNTA